MDYGFYLRVFLRRLPYFLVPLILGTVVGISVATMLPPVYQSQATLLVEQAQIPGNLASSTVRTDANEQIQVIRQRIQRRETLLDLSNRLNVYPEGSRMPADERVADMRRRIGISTYGGGRDSTVSFVNVSFSADSGQVAANVVNELTTIIQRENVEMRTTVAGQTLEFFQQETNRLDQELSDISSRILEFRENNLESLPDSLEFRRSRQSSLQEQLNRLDREQTELQDRRDRLQEMSDAGVRTAETGNLSPQEQQLAQLRNQYNSSTAVLSENNPRMQVLQTRIAQLEAAVAETQASQPDIPEGEEPPSALEIQIADLDTQLGYMSDRREQIMSQMEQLGETIQDTPSNALTLEALEREYSNVRQQYNEAVASRAKAETGDVIESLSKGQRITVVDQATAPRSPTSPNRPFIAAAGVAGGGAMGLAIVLLLEFLTTSVRRPADISNKLGVTPFGTVPYIRSEQELLRRRAIIIGTIALIVVGVPAGLWYIDSQIIPLGSVLERALAQFNIAALDLPSGMRPT